MMKFRDYSISRKLMWMNMLVSGLALLPACGAFVAYDLISFRETMVRRMSSEAQIVGSNSISALVFDDPHAAESTLSALEALPHILMAGIYTIDGRPFAAYSQNHRGQLPRVSPIPPGQTEVLGFKNRQMTLLRVIVFEGKPTGMVYIQSDLTEMYIRLRRYIVIATIVLASCLMAAFLISAAFQRALANPIVHLADIARTVSQDKDYSVRVRSTSRRDELGTLVAAFNEMLVQIQKRDAELLAAHSKLEQRVVLRTAQLEASNKALEAFSYSVSHDLRAPIRHISAFTEILEMEHAAELNPDGRNCLQRIRDGAKRMGQLIDDLLNLARVGRQELSTKITGLNSLVEQALDELKVEYSGRAIQWEIGGLPNVECDRGLMKQVFVNLLSNAIKYTRRREQAVIEIGQDPHNPEPVVFVRDNGAGFDQKYAHKLFGVFERLHGAEEFEGTGVGLATVRRIMEKHGGTVWAQGETNKGATVFLKFGGSNMELRHRE